MPQTSVERARLTRDRRRRGVRPVLVEVSQEVVEFLEVNGYLPDRTDAAIAAAVSRFLVDSASG
jgi:hypothetical protein